MRNRLKRKVKQAKTQCETGQKRKLNKKGPANHQSGEACFFAKETGLLTQTQSLHNSTITIDIVGVEILQELTTATYQLCQRTSSNIVLVVLLQVLGEVLDTIREQCNLALSATSVSGALAKLGEDLSLLVVVEIHNL